MHGRPRETRTSPVGPLPSGVVPPVQDAPPRPGGDDLAVRVGDVLVVLQQGAPADVDPRRAPVAVHQPSHGAAVWLVHPYPVG